MSSAGSINQLVEALQSGGPTLVLTGAGVSLASGIPTFRGTDAGAVWASNVMARATLEHFQREPADSWSWYRQRHAQVLAAQPNPAHRALVDLERWHAARGAGFQLITQNIDLLHEAAGARALVKVHGSIDRARCAGASCPESETTVPPASLDFSAFDAQPDAATVPRCAACGAADAAARAVVRRALRQPSRLRLAAGARGLRRDAPRHRHRHVVLGRRHGSRGQRSRRGAASRCSSIDPQGASIAGRGVIGLRDKAEELLPRVCALVGAPA